MSCFASIAEVIKFLANCVNGHRKMVTRDLANVDVLEIGHVQLVKIKKCHQAFLHCIFSTFSYYEMDASDELH